MAMLQIIKPLFSILLRNLQGEYKKMLIKPIQKTAKYILSNADKIFKDTILWLLSIFAFLISIIFISSHLWEYLFNTRNIDIIAIVIFIVFFILFVVHCINFFFIKKQFSDSKKRLTNNQKINNITDIKNSDFLGKDIRTYVGYLSQAFENSHQKIQQKNFKSYLERKIYSRELYISVGSSILISLGLIGTIWGLIVAIKGLEGVISDLENSEGLNTELKHVFSGMSKAFYTTFLGALFGGVFLKFLHNIYKKIAHETINNTELWVEIHILPILHSEIKPQDEKTLEKVIDKFNHDMGKQFGENFKRLDEACIKLLEWQENYKETIELSQTSHQKFIRQSNENYQTISSNSEKYFDTISKQLQDFIKQGESFNDITLNLGNNITRLTKENEKITLSLEQFVALGKQAKEGLGNLDNYLVNVRKILIDFATDYTTTAEKSLKKINQDHISSLKTLNQQNRENLKKLSDEQFEELKKRIKELVDNLMPILEEIPRLSKEFKTIKETK